MSEKTYITVAEAVEGIGLVAQEVNHWKDAFKHLRDEYPDSSAYRELAERYGMYAAALNTALATIQAQEEPTRLMMEKDWDDNPNVDADGFLPCWIEFTAEERANIQEDLGQNYEPDGWDTCKQEELKEKSFRLWNGRPTKKQMEETPWA